MRVKYTILGFLALTLAFMISTESRPTLVNLLDRLSTIKSVDGLGSGRGFITEKPPAASMSTSSINATTPSPASPAFPSQTSFSLPQQSKWGPGSIGNILFGCIASFLGVVTIGLTYHLHRRQAESQQPDDSMELDSMHSFEPSDGDGGDDLAHEDPPPAYAFVDPPAR